MVQIARWLSLAAFAIALIVVIARFTTVDALRDPWDAQPGADATAATPGPGTGLVFDLIAAFPALLVLVRRVIDRQFRLSIRLSHALLLALAGWMLLSTAWASDQFAAIVTASHFFAAACLLWAMSQLVRSFDRFRLVSAICFGLMLVLVAQSAIYRLVDVPQNIAYWNEHQDAILKSQNLEPDSFGAKQFQQKLVRGELVGFFNSSNTFAAVGVLLFFAAIGIGIQKLADRESQKWGLLIGIATIALIWILLCARSKTSAATPFVGIGLLALLLPFRRQIESRHRLVFTAGVGIVAFAMLAVIGHGIYHHGLFPGRFSNSLDFRWKYWVASMGIFKAHPWIGTGWNNFGLYYLAHRLPEAAEEIKDPHSFLVRFFVELGIVGGVLCIAWLLRSAWELTKPFDLDDLPNLSRDTGLRPVPESRMLASVDYQSLGPHQTPSTGQRPVSRFSNEHPLSFQIIAAIVLLGMLLSILANSDFSLPFAEMVVLALKPILYALLLVVGTIAASLRTSNRLDDRPARWIYYCTLTGLGLFLLHNLIDFSWFEAGPMLLFMALIGSAQGMAAEPRPRHFSNTAVVSGAAIYTIGWLAAAALIVLPILVAEDLAGSANESIRTAPLKDANGYRDHFLAAADDLRLASQWAPFNSDYLYRQARALISIRQEPAAQKLLDQAMRINPLGTDAIRLDATMQLHQPNPDPARVLARVMSDYQTLLRLNPNDVTLHLEYADALMRFGKIDDAKSQYRQAIAADAALPMGEPKRLSPAQVNSIRQKIIDHG